jgi:hypothetical protein
MIVRNHEGRCHEREAKEEEDEHCKISSCTFVGSWVKTCICVTLKRFPRTSSKFECLLSQFAYLYQVSQDRRLMMLLFGEMLCNSSLHNYHGQYGARLRSIIDTIHDVESRGRTATLHPRLPPGAPLLCLSHLPASARSPQPLLALPGDHCGRHVCHRRQC